MARWSSLRSPGRVYGLVALVLVVLLGGPRPALAANSGFVSASGGQFVLNGHAFFFVGTNAYYLIPAATWGNLSYTDESMAMAQSLGLTVFRTWGFFNDPNQPTALQPAPGVYNEASFQAMDYVLHKADQAGVRLLISLVNRWTDFGGMDRYVSWCAPGSNFEVFYTNAYCKQLYKNYVSKVLNRVNTYNGRRYKDDPTVFAWELANELETSNDFDRSGQVVGSWIAEMADYVKSIDPNHMVTTGEQGYDTTTAGYSTGSYNNQAWLFNGHKGVSFSENTADPNIDFASIHLYPEYWNLSSTAGNSWIADHVRIARQLGKPLVIGEFGYSSNPAAVYDQWLQTADVENAGGSLMWQLMCQSCYAMRDNFGVAYPPASAVSEVLVHAAQVANAKSGSASPPPSSPTSVSFTIGTTSATPSVVGTGQGVAIAAAVTAAASSTALVDLEVYDTAGTKVAQQIYAAQSFNAGQTRTYTWTWPGAAAAGTYTVKVGVVSNDWSTLYAWKDPAATVTVQASGGAAVSFVVKSTSVKPTSVRRGGTVKIRMSVQAKAAASAILDLEIFDAKGARVAQTSCSRTFAANETLSCSWAYSVPSSLAKGRYTVKVGVFSTSGSTVYAWVDSAGTFSVQ